MQNKLLVIFVAALAFLAGAWLWLEERESPPDESISGQRLFPALEQQLNDITLIRIEHGGSVYEVIKKDAQWQLPDTGGYPVLFERIKPLLLGVARLEKFEPKTARPENYGRLGVQEPSAESDNTRLELYTTADTPVASLIIGKTATGLISGDRDGIYVRVPGNPRSWLVAGNLDLPQAPVDWVDQQIIHVKPKRVKRVTIRYPNGDSLVVEKSHRGAANYTLVNIPAGTAQKNSAELNALARSLAGLKMEGVQVRAGTGLSETEAVSAVFDTWDGLQVTAYTIEQGHKMLAWFDIGVTDPSGDKNTHPETAALRSRLNGWVYQIPQARADKLRARLADLGNTALFTE